LEVDSHLLAIRRNFIPEIIRVVYSHVKNVAPAVEKAERANLPAVWDDDPAGLRQEIRRRASTILNKLTADLVRTLYPFWGWDVSARRVRMTIENTAKTVRHRR
jgi:hypothetical protein